jgi:hypothetical protein
LLRPRPPRRRRGASPFMSAVCATGSACDAPSATAG